MYIADLYTGKWNSVTAQTQFQRPASYHDLAALTLKETINFSLYVLSRAVFVLYLDAKSAFDLVIRECMIQKLLATGRQYVSGVEL